VFLLNFQYIFNLLICFIHSLVWTTFLIDRYRKVRQTFYNLNMTLKHTLLPTSSTHLRVRERSYLKHLSKIKQQFFCYTSSKQLYRTFSKVTVDKTGSFEYYVSRWPGKCRYLKGVCGGAVGNFDFSLK
jgi:hypothetical protein